MKNGGKRPKEKQRELIDRRKRQRKKRKTALAVLISAASLILVLVVVLVAVLISKRAEDSGYFLRRTNAVSTDSTKVDCAMCQIYMHEYISDYVASTYPDCGFDVSLPLEDQLRPEGGRSWRDYFLSIATETASEYASLVSAAGENGFELTTSEKNAVDEKVSLLDPKDFGKGIDRDDLTRAYRYSTLALKYKATLANDFTMSDAELDAEYRENRAEYEKAGFRFFALNYADGQTEESALEYANALAKAKSEDEFVKMASAFAENLEGVSEDGAKAVSGYEYDAEDGGLSEWLFGKGVSFGDTKVIKDAENSRFTVFFVTSPPSKDETRTANVRHILMTQEYTGLSDGEINERLVTLRDRYLKGGEDEHDFGLMALAYSCDYDTAFLGGEKDNIVKGEMPEEFDAFCFDPSRQKGDIGIVKASYGWHLILYLGDGMPTYRARVLEAKRAEYAESTFKGIKELYAPSVSENDLYRIK